PPAPQPREEGGLSAIAISHPHYSSSMVEWSRAFGGVSVYLHADDPPWGMRPDQAVTYWGSETRALGDCLSLIRCGGHFGGGPVLHWAGGAGVRPRLCPLSLTRPPSLEAAGSPTQPGSRAGSAADKSPGGSKSDSPLSTRMPLGNRPAHGIEG